MWKAVCETIKSVAHKARANMNDDARNAPLSTSSAPMLSPVLGHLNTEANFATSKFTISSLSLRLLATVVLAIERALLGLFF